MIKTNLYKSSLVLLLLLAGAVSIVDVILTFVTIWLYHNEVLVEYIPHISLYSNLVSFTLISIAVLRLFKHFRTNAKQLKALDEKQKEYAWQTEGIRSVMDILDKNNDNLLKMSNQISRFLLDYTGMLAIGLFARADDNGDLDLVTHLGFQIDQNHLKLDLHQGLYSNLLQSSRPIVLRQIPNKYLIKSNFFEIQPQSIVILPLLFNRRLAGVLEIAFDEPLTTYKLDFLEKISESVAATILEIRQDKQAKLLLHESQQLTISLKEREEDLKQHLEETRSLQEQLQHRIVQTERIKNELLARDKVLNISALVTETDIYGTITYANEKFCEVSGYSLRECVGSPHNIVRHTDTPKEVFKEMWATIKQGNVFKGIIKNRTKEGLEYWVDATIAPILNEKGTPLRYIGVRFDITKQVLQSKQIQELLFESLDVNKTLQTKEQELVERNIDLVNIQEKLEEANEFLEEKVLERTQEILLQKEAIEHQKNEIESSIRYAKRIQEAMLPQEILFKNAELKYFLLYQPRNIVSGDFYWLAESGAYSHCFLEKNPHRAKEYRYCLFAAADCTGHGVPGAFMSMIGISKLNQIVKEQEIIDTDLILSLLNKEVNTAMSVYNNGKNLRDGMDIALCCWDKEQKILHFSGAINPLIYIQHGELRVVKGDKRPIGGGFSEEINHQFASHQIDVQSPTMLYLFSDGFQDQFGGQEGKKFMSARFRNLLSEIYTLPMEGQRRCLQETFEDWKGGKYKQIDDVLVLGIEI